MKKAILILLTIFLTIGLCSCGARKKEKSNLTEIVKTEEVKKETETEKEDTNVQKTEETKTNSQTGTTTKKITTRPIDPTKPATVTDKKGNKTKLDNAELVEEETTTNNSTITDQKSALDIKAKKERTRILEEQRKVATKKEEEILNLKRDKFSMWNFLWLLIPAGIVFLIYRFKDKIWWI